MKRLVSQVATDFERHFVEERNCGVLFEHEKWGGGGSNEISGMRRDIVYKFINMNMQNTGIPETGKLTVSQPESFMVKFGDVFLCGEDGL